MRKFQTDDLVRYKGRLYTVEHVDEEGNYHIVPRHISNKEDESLETANEYRESMINSVPENELTSA